MSQGTAAIDQRTGGEDGQLLDKAGDCKISSDIQSESAAPGPGPVAFEGWLKKRNHKSTYKSKQFYFRLTGHTLMWSSGGGEKEKRKHIVKSIKLPNDLVICSGTRTRRFSLTFLHEDATQKGIFLQTVSGKKEMWIAAFKRLQGSEDSSEDVPLAQPHVPSTTTATTVVTSTESSVMCQVSCKGCKRALHVHLPLSLAATLVNIAASCPTCGHLGRKNDII